MYWPPFWFKANENMSLISDAVEVLLGMVVADSILN
jgi:hypothetical protein